MKRIDKLKQLPIEEALIILFKEFKMYPEKDDFLMLLIKALCNEVRCDFCPLQSKCEATARPDVTCFSTVRDYLLEDMNG